MSFILPPTIPLAAAGVNGIIDLNLVKWKLIAVIPQTSIGSGANLPITGYNLSQYKKVRLIGQGASVGGGIKMEYSINNGSSYLTTNISGFLETNNGTSNAISNPGVLQVCGNDANLMGFDCEFSTEKGDSNVGGLFRSSYFDVSGPISCSAKGFQNGGLTGNINAFRLLANSAGGSDINFAMYGLLKS